MGKSYQHLDDWKNNSKVMTAVKTIEANSSKRLRAIIRLYSIDDITIRDYNKINPFIENMNTDYDTVKE